MARNSMGCWGIYMWIGIYYMGFFSIINAVTQGPTGSNGPKYYITSVDISAGKVHTPPMETNSTSTAWSTCDNSWSCSGDAMGILCSRTPAVKDWERFSYTLTRHCISLTDHQVVQWTSRSLASYIDEFDVDSSDGPRGSVKDKHAVHVCRVWPWEARGH